MKLYSGRARRANARKVNLGLERRFDLVWNFTHAFCLAALRRLSYRANHRCIVFQTLPHTLGLGPEVWRVVDKCRQMRNVAEYEDVLDLDERNLTDLVAVCETVISIIDRTQGIL